MNWNSHLTGKEQYIYYWRNSKFRKKKHDSIYFWSWFNLSLIYIHSININWEQLYSLQCFGLCKCKRQKHLMLSQLFPSYKQTSSILSDTSVRYCVCYNVINWIKMCCSSLRQDLSINNNIARNDWRKIMYQGGTL